MMKLNELRREFPLTKELTFLDHAATSPLPKRTRAAMARFIEARRFVRQTWEEYETLDQDLRQALGQLINASAQEIAFVHNTAEGISIAAHAIPLQPGDIISYSSRPITWLRNSVASSGVKRKSGERSSANCPRPRRCARGRGGSERVAMTKCIRRGRWSSRKVRALWMDCASITW